jgi:hypothetical protein
MDAHGAAAELPRVGERGKDVRPRRVGAEVRVLDAPGQLARVYFFFSL